MTEVRGWTAEDRSWEGEKLPDDRGQRMDGGGQKLGRVE